MKSLPERVVKYARSPEAAPILADGLLHLGERVPEDGHAVLNGSHSS